MRSFAARAVVTALATMAVVVSGLVVGASPAAAASNLTVEVSGFNLVVRWTPTGSESGSGMAYVSATPGFADATTCQGYGLSKPEALLSACTFPVGATAWVKVEPTSSGSPIVVEVPVTWNFAPQPLAAAPVAWHNRQQVECAATLATWANINPDTTFTGRVMVDGQERAAETLYNPITGDADTSVAEASVAYAFTGRDVGKAAACEVTARNGQLSATWTASTVIARAAPADMRPDLMLGEISAPKGYTYFKSPRLVKVGKLDAKRGALRKAKGEASYGVSGDLNFAVTTYSTKPQARPGSVKSICKALRKSTRKASTKSHPRTMLTCRKATLGSDADAVYAVRMHVGYNDIGVLMATFQALSIGSVGVVKYQVSSTWGSTYKARKKSLRKAVKALRVSGPALADAAARE